MKEDTIEDNSIVDKEAVQKKAEEVATMLKKSNSYDKKCVYKPVFLLHRNHNSSYKLPITDVELKTIPLFSHLSYTVGVTSFNPYAFIPSLTNFISFILYLAQFPSTLNLSTLFVPLTYPNKYKFYLPLHLSLLPHMLTAIQ